MEAIHGMTKVLIRPWLLSLLLAVPLLLVVLWLAYQYGYSQADLSCRAHLNPEGCYEPLHSMLRGTVTLAP